MMCTGRRFKTRFAKRLSAAINGLSLLTLAVCGYPASNAKAQIVPPPNPPAAAPVDSGSSDPVPTTGLALSFVVKKIAKAVNVQIIMDTVSASALVTPPGKATTPDNFENQIDGLVAQLPAGSTWAKLYLPDVPGKTYSGDDLSDYAVAASKVFGAVGGALPPGTVEVLGQKLSADKAASVIAALNLKTVYLIINPSPAKSAGGLTQQQWAALTPDQKQQFAQGQAQLLLSLDPGQRSQALMQMFGQATAVAVAMLQALPAAEQKQFVQGIMSSLGVGATSHTGPAAP